VDFQGSRVTSDVRLILIRELDERLGLGDLIAEHLSDALSISPLDSAQRSALALDLKNGRTERKQGGKKTYEGRS
jgi:hypothetical protein